MWWSRTLLTSALIARITKCSVVVDPSTGRVIETIESYPKMDDDLFSRVLLQLDEDAINAEFTPNIMNESLWTENTSRGILKIQEIIYTGRVSLVASITDHPDLLIKYQANCGKGKSVHPLIRDFWYSSDAHLRGLAPNPQTVSPPSLLCEQRAGKCGFNITDDLYESCRSKNGTLRYMIMKKAKGESLHAFRYRYFALANGVMGVYNAAFIGGKLIALIQKLHEKALVVHGDIHSPNVMIDMDPVSKNVELKLIDFGAAFRTLEDPLPEVPITFPGILRHKLHTIWQILGFAWSPRDDILRAIQTVAQLMQPYDYSSMESEIANSGAIRLQSWKQSGNWFITDLFDPVSNITELSPETRDRTYAILDEILSTGRNLKINEPIPYGKLVDYFAELVKLTKRKTMTTSTTSSPEY